MLAFDFPFEQSRNYYLGCFVWQVQIPPPVKVWPAGPVCPGVKFLPGINNWSVVFS